MSIKKLRPTFSFDEERLAQLRAVVPEAFADGKVNWETLREALGDCLEDEEAEAEHFGLFWPGKREARRAASMPSTGALVPQPGLGVDEEATRNLFIEGDNLEVLKLLQKSYAGRVKMIYIDPPYNTGNDFIYKDDYSEPTESYLQRTEQTGEKGELLTSNPKTSGRFHSNWLSMMYPRLRLARQLLRDDGVIFVSIDDNEVYNLRQLMNEIFGEENFIDSIIWKKRYGGGAKERFLVSLHEYVLFYAKNKDLLDALFVPLDPNSVERYYKQKDEKFNVRGPYRTHPLEATKSMGERKNLVYPIPAPDGTQVWPKRQWLWAKERALEALQNNELEFIKGKEGWTVHTKQYLRDATGKPREAKAFSIIDDVYTQHGTNEILDIFGDAQTFAFPKPTGLIKPLLQLATRAEDNDIILDFFAGACTTAQAVLDLNREDGGNRRFTMVQIDEDIDNPDFSTVADIGRERIRRVIAKMKKEAKGKMNLHPGEDLGFKCYHFDDSSFKPWHDYAGEDAAELQKRFDQFETPLADDWQPENLLVEVLLMEGFPLDSTIARQKIARNQVAVVSSDFHEHRLLVCLDKHVTASTIEKLELGDHDIFVCLDSALDDETKLSLADKGNLHVI